VHGKEPRVMILSIIIKSHYKFGCQEISLDLVGAVHACIFSPSFFFFFRISSFTY